MDAAADGGFEPVVVEVELSEVVESVSVDAAVVIVAVVVMVVVLELDDLVVN